MRGTSSTPARLHLFSSSRPASSTPAAGVEEGAGVEEAGVEEVRQPVAAGRGRF